MLARYKLYLDKFLKKKTSQSRKIRDTMSVLWQYICKIFCCIDIQQIYLDYLMASFPPPNLMCLQF